MTLHSHLASQHPGWEKRLCHQLQSLLLQYPQPSATQLDSRVFLTSTCWEQAFLPSQSTSKEEVCVQQARRWVTVHSILTSNTVVLELHEKWSNMSFPPKHTQCQHRKRMQSKVDAVHSLAFLHADSPKEASPKQHQCWYVGPNKTLNTMLGVYEDPWVDLWPKISSFLFTDRHSVVGHFL